MSNAILDFLDHVTDAVTKVSPIATAMGIPFVESVSKWADTAVDIAMNAVERAEDAKVVLTSQDEEDINKRIAALRAMNDSLAEYIKNS